MEINKTNIAFVRIPKTAGTFLNISTLPTDYSYGSIHLSVSEILNIVGDSIDLFTVVRDPYDRACSEYFFIKKIVSIISSPDADTNNEEYLTYISNVIMNNLSAKIYYDKTYSIYKYNMSLDDYLYNYNNFQTYPHYYDLRLPNDFDLVGITESIDKTIYLLSSMYGIKFGDGKLNANLNKCHGLSYSTSYSRLDFQINNRVEYEIYDQAKNKFNYLYHKYI